MVIAGLLSFAGAAQAAIPASERTVLLNFYTSTGGATWTTSTNWNGAAGTECTWYGVTCDGGGTTVTDIALSVNNLTGSLPGNLNGLTNLLGLNVASNQLTGSIPALTGLTILRRIRVNNNQLTGNVPSVPAPNDLRAGYSLLCPNFLNQTTNAEWDIATGVTPWFANCASAPLPPALLGAASRKVHGVAGTFELPLSLTPVTNPTTEPRQGPAQAIVFTFDKPINAATVTVIEGSATAASPTFSANDVVVGLSNVTNQQYVTVSLTNVGSSDGGTGGSGSVRIGFLAGDVN